MKFAHIVGWGRFLPNRILTNHDIAQIVDTSDDWIYSRTGIRQRRIANEQETTATMAFEAAARALAMADLHPSQVDLVIVATSTPEYIFPSTASRVQDYLGAHRAGAFDLSAACSGFVYALNMASQAITTGSVRNAVVVGSETMSRVVDWTDRATCILFGDGAGAVVLKGSEVPGGLLAATMRSDGSGADLLSLPAVYHNPVPTLGPEFLGNGHKDNTIVMHGRQIFRFASEVVQSSIEEVTKQANMTLDDIDLIIPHQANGRILEHVAKKLKIPLDKFYSNVEWVGNTSAASIPIALCDAADAGRLRPDNNVIFIGFGGGLTWASAAFKWDVSPPHVAMPESEWRRTRYMIARGRSRWRKWRRRVGARIAGSPTPDARLKDAEKRE